MASSLMTTMDQLNSKVEEYRGSTDALEALDSYRQALSSILAQIESASQDYSQRYSQIQRLQYDADGNVEDVTPGNNLGYATAAYSKAKQAVADLVTQADVARRQFESATELVPFSKVSELMGYIRRCNLRMAYPYVPLALSWNASTGDSKVILRGFASPEMPGTMDGNITLYTDNSGDWIPPEIADGQRINKHCYGAVSYVAPSSQSFNTGCEAWVKTTRVYDYTKQELILMLGSAILVTIQCVTPHSSSLHPHIEWEAFHITGKFQDMANHDYEISSPTIARGSLTLTSGSVPAGASICGIGFMFTSSNHEFKVTKVTFRHAGMADPVTLVAPRNGKVDSVTQLPTSADLTANEVQEFPAVDQAVVDTVTEQAYSTPVSAILPDATDLVEALNSIDTAPKT